jgi:hypothetical protein
MHDSASGKEQSDFEWRRGVPMAGLLAAKQTIEETMWGFFQSEIVQRLRMAKPGTMSAVERSKGVRGMGLILRLKSLPPIMDYLLFSFRFTRSPPSLRRSMFATPVSFSSIATFRALRAP